MPVINLDSVTATAPSEIPGAGGTVRFLVRAHCPTGEQLARFTFELGPLDGYRWSSGRTSTTEDRTITNVDAEIPIDLTLQRSAETNAKLLLIEIRGVLVAGSAEKGSVAKLTVNDGLGALLVAHRGENDLTQSALAHNLGISTSWLGRVENGASPSPKLLKDIKHVLEV